MNDPHREIEALRAALAVLEEENAQLSERAEDAMLLAQVAEAIETVTEPVKIVERLLERISILKDLPYVTCGRLEEQMVERIMTYCSLTDAPLAGYPLGFEREVMEELQLGPFLSGELQGVQSSIARIFQPGGALIIPFQCHIFGQSVLLACCRADDRGRLGQLVFLLDQAVRMTVARLDNIFLGRQLALLNSQLEERVVEKTRDLQRAHTDLERSRDRLQTILHGIDSYIHVTDTRSYRLLFANQAAINLFGHGIEGQECFRALRQYDHPCDFCRIPQLLAATATDEKRVAWESYNPKSGRWFLNSECIVDWPDSPQALLTVGADITDIKHAEEEKQLLARKLHQAQKLEAIGVLAGSIAHDLNNILSGVVSYPDLLLTSLPEDSPLCKGLETIRAAGIKAAKIVQGLLTLSRRGMQVDEQVELGQLIGEYLGSAECMDLLHNHPQVRIVGPERDEPLTVMGSPAHLANVVMNLVMNGVEAMADGGTIVIGLERVKLSEQPPGFSTWRAGEYVHLTVSDTGVGIPDEHLERVFDPFFTLKRPGKSGTGLGLAVVWGTVADHLGHVEIESSQQQGTTFHVYLPLSDSISNGGVRPRNGTIVRGNGEVVLVVDDDPEQRRIAAESLAHLGYEVMKAGCGEEAVRILGDRTVDLVLLDMLMMPGMDGLDTYRKISILRPEQKVIIVSGYSRSERVKRAMELGAGHYLQKPYTLVGLSEAIAAILSDK